MLTISPAAPTPSRSRSISFPSQVTCSLSRSPLTSQAQLPPPSTEQPPALASTSLVVALEQQVEQRFCHLEQQLSGQFSELLACIRAPQAPAAAAPPVLNLPSGLPPPRPHLHPAGFDLASLQPLAPAGESQSLSVSCSFAWVLVDVITLIERDQLKPEHMVKLRNPESRISREASRSTGLMLTNWQLSIVEDSSDAQTSAFVKAILSIAALAQVWLVYVAIHTCHMANLELNSALLAHLEQLIEFDHLYLWRAVADYHLAVCCQRFGTTAVSEWASYDPQVAGRVLFPFQKSSHTSSHLDNNLSSGSDQPPPTHPSRSHPCPIPGTASELIETCRRFNAGHFTAVKRAPPAVLDTLNVAMACTAFKCATASNAAKCAFPAVPYTLNVVAMACTASKCAAASTAVECAHGVRDTCNASSQVRYTFNLRLWSWFLDLYPDQIYTDQLRGALRHGTKLGYKGPLHLAARLDAPNLPLDNHDVSHLCQEIAARLQEGCLREVPDPNAAGLICSLISVVPKANSDKRCTIYHLSHPRKPGSRLPSVNSGIHTSFVAIHYENLDTVMDFVREHPGALLWKADLEDAFRHVIVAKSDARLMGIHFYGTHYQECALAFGARSSPFLFNLFAKFLHWLVAFALQSVSASLPSTHSGVSHYLDDFFGASDLTANPVMSIQLLSLTATALSFKISAKKTLWDTTKLEILGIELNSVAQTALITTQHRLCILQLCMHIVERGRASLLELQQVVGHLQFVTGIAPHGGAYLHRIYDAVCPLWPPHQQEYVSRAPLVGRHPQRLGQRLATSTLFLTS
ncbi:hypothetical protein NDA13_001401 [Ustilago tritici]|nr:hypothetical protein NDA13_001401 [Ustilago tritici]